MKHKEITVGLSRTYSLPNYGNVRPSVSYTVELEDGDDLDAVIATMTSACNIYICREIDAQREQVGLPVIYNTNGEPRVDLMEWASMGIVLLLYPGLRKKFDMFMPFMISLDPICEYEVAPLEQRYSYALRHISQYAESHGFEFLDWSSFDSEHALYQKMWEFLEERRAFTFASYREHAFIIPASVARQYVESADPHGKHLELTFFSSQDEVQRLSKRYLYTYHLNDIIGLRECLIHVYKTEQENIGGDTSPSDDQEA